MIYNKRKRCTLFFNILLSATVGSGIISCSGNTTEQTVQAEEYLVSFEDPATYGIGYKNTLGDIIIPAGKYPMCFTDTFRQYAIVALQDGKIVSIDRNEKVKYEVFNYDNGPDDPSCGLFRIVKNNKIGFADEKTGEIVIEPQFDCADPFTEITYLKNTEGQLLSAVSNDCGYWTTEDGYVYYHEPEKKLNILYIDPKGNVITTEAEEFDTYEEKVHEIPVKKELRSSEVNSVAPQASKSSSYLGLGQYKSSEKSSICATGYSGSFHYFVWDKNGVKGGKWTSINVCFSESKNGVPKEHQDVQIYGYHSQTIFFVTSWKYDYNEDNSQRPVMETFDF